MLQMHFSSLHEEGHCFHSCITACALMSKWTKKLPEGGACDYVEKGQRWSLFKGLLRNRKDLSTITRDPLSLIYVLLYTVFTAEVLYQSERNTAGAY